MNAEPGLTGEARYCDLVMKGGITSGLVYPKAVIEIGRRYRFRSVGGTSAGAIAAALSAAAALGERRRSALGTTDGGMERLEATAAQLSAPGRIFSLFQPIPRLRTAFELLVRLSKKPTAGTMAWLIVSRSLVLAPVSFLAVIAVLATIAFVMGGWPGVLAAAIPSVGCALLLAILRAASATAEQLRGNMLGMCPGKSQPGNRELGLSDWMHAEIRALAGFGDGDGPPVLFRDLWSAPAYPDEAAATTGERVLSLEVITTDVSHSEPRTLPFAKGTLWFRETDMLRLFPESVVSAMIDPAEPTLLDAGVEYRPFPIGGALPIVVAARMSLSFPLLICAVPLFEQHFLRRAEGPIDVREAPAAAAPAAAALSEATEELTSASSEDPGRAASFEMRVCWFTDGGVSSNFPLHLFDAPMPRWPTFAIDLVYPPEGTPPSPSPVFLPTGNDQGWRQRYTSLDRSGGVQAVGAFLFGIVATMQNWRDLIQGRAPGHRDRIVQVEIEPTEGGMNLDMPADVLAALAEKGALAGRVLGGFDFENHYWVRYRNLQASMERYGLGLHTAFASSPAGAEGAFERAREGLANEGPYPFNVGQAREAARRLNELVAEVELWADWDGSLANGAPNPPPTLRITPTF